MEVVFILYRGSFGVQCLFLFGPGNRLFAGQSCFFILFHFRAENAALDELRRHGRGHDGFGLRVIQVDRNRTSTGDIAFLNFYLSETAE